MVVKPDDFPPEKIVPLSKLKPYPDNPRTMDEPSLRGLKASLREFGLVDPLVVNPRNEVVGGNQRLKALKELGYTKARVILVDLPKDREMALNIGLNNAAIQGKYTDAVYAQIEEIRIKDLGLVDSLRLDEIKLDIDTDAIDKDLDEALAEEETVPEMELLPYEHYDYVVILCRNTFDWRTLTEKLDLKDIRDRGRIGLGRAIPFEKFAEKVGWQK